MSCEARRQLHPCPPRAQSPRMWYVVPSHLMPRFLLLTSPCCPRGTLGKPQTRRGSTREPLAKSSQRRATLASRRRACRWSRFLLPRRRPPGCRLRTLWPRRWPRAAASRARRLHLLPAQRSNCSEARVSGGGRTPRSLSRRRTRMASTRSVRCLTTAHASATTVLTTRAHSLRE